MLYVYSCDDCGVDTEALRSVEQRYDSPPCKLCQGRTHLVIQPVRGVVKDPAVQRKKHL